VRFSAILPPANVNCPVREFLSDDSYCAFCPVVRYYYTGLPRTKSSNSIDKHIGNRVRMRRTMLDMSLAKLGDALGVTVSKFRNTRRGRTRLEASSISGPSTCTPGRTS
jgi:hypothetical protein